MAPRGLSRTVGQRVGGAAHELPAGVVQVLDLEAVGRVDARAGARRAARRLAARLAPRLPARALRQRHVDALLAAWTDNPMLQTDSMLFTFHHTYPSFEGVISFSTVTYNL